MEQVLATIGVIFLVAFLVESLVEYLVGTPFDNIAALAPYKWLLAYIAAAVGVGAAWLYQFDLVYLLARFGAVESIADPSPLGMVLTGLAIGRGAGFLNDVVSQFFGGSSEPNPS